MASNQPAYAPPSDVPDTGAYAHPAGEQDVWNPTEDSADLLRGKHRLPKQRGIARGSTVLGVAALAAVGAGGIAAAADRSPVPISMPDLPDLPKVADMPGIGDLVAAGEPSSDAAAPAAATTSHLAEDAGESLRVRILEQVTRQRDAQAGAVRQQTAQDAAAQAAKEAAAQKVRDDAAAAKAAAETAAAAKKQAAAEAAADAEAARLAQLAASYLKPVASYVLTAGFGESSSLWANTHTGQDFAAPTGTPVSALHSGTITSAAWAGSYGYRIVLTLDDGTEIWYCHLSSMVKTSGPVTTGDTIGRVGATGNVTGPHLHLEVRPDGGAPIDPAPWLHDHGIDI